MTKLSAMVLAVACLVAGCSDRRFDEAEEAVRLRMKDPASTQFRNLRFCGGQAGDVIEGEANSRNSYGAYEGYEPFHYLDGEVTFYQQPGASLGLFDRCIEQIKRHTAEITASAGQLKGDGSARPAGQAVPR